MRACLGQLQRDEVPVWVAMIHSSEIGINRYFPKEGMVELFRDRCFGLVEDALAKGAKAATLEEVWRRFADIPSPLHQEEAA